MSDELYCGIEIGGTKIQCAVGSDEGEIVDRLRFGVDVAAGGAGIRDELGRRLPALLARFPVRGVGVGFGGPVDGAKGLTVTSHQVAGWDRFPLRDWIAEATHLPSAVENDAKCAGWAEYARGAGRGSRTMVYMNIGSGIGGCFVLGGRLYNGQGFGAAEIGHTRVPLPVGGEDTLERFASGWAFEERLRAAYTPRPGERLTELCGGRRERIDGKLAARAAAEGDPAAIEAFREEAEAVGIALANVIALICPEVIALGGGLALAGDVLLAPVRAAIDRHVMRAFRGTYQIRGCETGEDAVVTGALLLAAGRIERL